jgi:hypothetical protein
LPKLPRLPKLPKFKNARGRLERRRRIDSLTKPRSPTLGAALWPRA